MLERISLPKALSQNYDALVADGKDNLLVAITGANGSGIAVVDLTSVPQPLPLRFGGSAWLGVENALTDNRCAERSTLKDELGIETCGGGRLHTQLNSLHLVSAGSAKGQEQPKIAERAGRCRTITSHTRACLAETLRKG